MNEKYDHHPLFKAKLTISVGERFEQGVVMLAIIEDAMLLTRDHPVTSSQGLVRFKSK